MIACTCTTGFAEAEPRQLSETEAAAGADMASAASAMLQGPGRKVVGVGRI